MLSTIDRSQQVGFLGGTLTSVVVNISIADVMATIILAIVGTLVSFLLSILLKRGFKKCTASGDSGKDMMTNG